MIEATERATKLIRGWNASPDAYLLAFGKRIEDAIRAAEEAATLAERERCREIIDRISPNLDDQETPLSAAYKALSIAVRRITAPAVPPPSPDASDIPAPLAGSPVVADRP